MDRGAWQATVYGVSASDMTDSMDMSLSKLWKVVKNQPANAGDIRYSGLIPGSGRVFAGGHSNPLQYSCLENLMVKGA